MRCKWLQGATNLLLIYRHCNCKPGTSQGPWIYSESCTLTRLQQTALGCRSCAEVTHGCRYSQMLSAKRCKGEQSTDALRESQPSCLHYWYCNRQLLGDWYVIGKITLCYLVIGFITCNPQASGIYPQKWALLQSLGSAGMKKEPLHWTLSHIPLSSPSLGQSICFKT